MKKDKKKRKQMRIVTILKNELEKAKDNNNQVMLKAVDVMLNSSEPDEEEMDYWDGVNAGLNDFIACLERLLAGARQYNGEGNRGVGYDAAVRNAILVLANATEKEETEHE